MPTIAAIGTELSSNTWPAAKPKMLTTTSDTCGTEEAAGAVRPSAAKAEEGAMDNGRRKWRRRLGRRWRIGRRRRRTAGEEAEEYDRQRKAAVEKSEEATTMAVMTKTKIGTSIYRLGRSVRGGAHSPHPLRVLHLFTPPYLTLLKLIIV